MAVEVVSAALGISWSRLSSMSASDCSKEDLPFSLEEPLASPDGASSFAVELPGNKKFLVIV